MSGKLRLTVACGDYEIVRAAQGRRRSRPTASSSCCLTGMGSRERHWRLARKNEFDVCEINVGAYFMARDRGDPLTAIPVYPASPLPPRLRVRQHREPASASRRTSPARGSAAPISSRPSNIWMRGILEENYGVPHRSATWVVEREEDVKFTGRPRPAHRDDRARQDARRHAGGRRNPRHAVADPAAAASSKATSGSCGCFPTTSRSRSTITAQTGIFPIMHVTTIKQEIVDKYPWVADQSGQGVRGSRSRSPTAASRTRAWCRSPGCAPPARSRRRCSGPTRGPMGSAPANRKNLEDHPCATPTSRA